MGGSDESLHIVQLAELPLTTDRLRSSMVPVINVCLVADTYRCRHIVCIVRCLSSTFNDVQKQFMIVSARDDIFRIKYLAIRAECLWDVLYTSLAWSGTLRDALYRRQPVLNGSVV